MAQLSKKKRPAKPPRPRRDRPVDTAARGKSATDRKAGLGDSARRNVSESAARKSEVKLESSATKPSRKSTRASQNRGRVASNLENRELNKRRSPEFRAEKARAQAKTVRGRRRSSA